MNSIVLFLAFFGTVVATGYFVINLNSPVHHLSIVTTFSLPKIQRAIRTSETSGWAATNDTIYRWIKENNSVSFEKELEMGTRIAYFTVDEPELFICSGTNVYRYHTKSKLFTHLLSKVGYTAHPLRSKQAVSIPYDENRVLNCKTMTLSHDKQHLYVGDEYNYESFIWKLDLKPSQCLKPVARGFYNIAHLLDTEKGLWIGEKKTLSRIKNRIIHSVTFPALITDINYQNQSVWVITQDYDQEVRLLQFRASNLTKTFDRHYGHRMLSRSTLYINDTSKCFTSHRSTICTH